MVEILIFAYCLYLCYKHGDKIEELIERIIK